MSRFRDGAGDPGATGVPAWLGQAVQAGVRAGLALQRFLVPPVCRLCAQRLEPGSADEAAMCCAGCRAALPWNRVACPRCARPLASPVAHECPRCLRQAPPQDLTVAAFRYEEPVAGLIHAVKYHARLEDAAWLSAALLECLQARVAAGHPLPEVLIPVPLHSGRLRRRGYNQALELARPLARGLGLRLLPHAAVRTRATPDQIGQKAAQRRRNVRGAFALKADLRGRRVALLDDVMTTGSTLAELTRACRRAGAVSVELWVVARAG